MGSSNTSHQSLSLSSPSSTSSSTLSQQIHPQQLSRSTSPMGTHGMARHNYYNNINYTQNSENISNYSVNQFMKRFVSGYFIFDVIFMLYSDQSSKEFCVYFLLLVGGTALDLIILNDIYLFDGHNQSLKAAYDFIDQNTSLKEKELLGFSSSGGTGRSYAQSGNTNNYQSQLGSGIALRQFLDTCLLTILVTYRIFRIYSVAKKWYPKFKQTYKVLTKDSSIQYSSQVLTDSSYDEIDTISPELTANNSITISSQNNHASIGLNHSIAENTQQAFQTEANANEEALQKQIPNITQVDVYEEKKILDNQFNDQNLTNSSLKNTNNQQNLQQVVAQTPPQQNQNRSQTLSKQRTKNAAPGINQDMNGTQVQSININQKDVMSSQNKLKKKVERSQQLNTPSFNTLEEGVKENLQTDQMQNTTQRDLNDDARNNNTTNQSRQQSSQNQIKDTNIQQNNFIGSVKGRNCIKKQQGKTQQSKLQTSLAKNIIENNSYDNKQNKNVNSSSNISHDLSNIIKIGDSLQSASNQTISNNQSATINILSKNVLRAEANKSTLNARNVKEQQIEVSPNPRTSLNNQLIQSNTLSQQFKVSSSAQDKEKLLTQDQRQMTERSNKQNNNSKKQQVYVQKKPAQQQGGNQNSSSKGYSIITTKVQGSSPEKRSIQNLDEYSWQQGEQIVLFQNGANSDNKSEAQLMEQNCGKIQVNKLAQISEEKSNQINTICSNQEQVQGNINDKDRKVYNNSSIINYTHAYENQTALSNTEQEEEDREINIQRVSPSSLNESNGENSSLTSSPKHSTVHTHNTHQIHSGLLPAAAVSDGLASTNSQNKSACKFSYEQDDESSSEDNNDRGSQHVYKEDSHFDAHSSSKSPCFLLGCSSQSQQPISNSSRKLADSKNRSSRKSVLTKQSNTAIKTPIGSPSNNINKRMNSSQSYSMEKKNTTEEIDYEIVNSTQPQKTTEQRIQLGESLTNIQIDPASFKLDPAVASAQKVEQLKQITQTTQARQKDSWESVTDFIRDEGHENDPENINYLANPLLEALSLPFRSPNLQAVSPTMKDKPSTVITYNGLLYQQIGNWNESQQISQKSATPEIIQTTSTLSPKYRQNCIALSDNPNDKAKKRKSTNVNSEDLVSDQDKQHTQAWRIFSGEDDNSYEDQQDYQDQYDQDSNLDQNPESKSQYMSSKKNMQLFSAHDKESPQKPIIEKVDFHQSRDNLYTTLPHNSQQELFVGSSSGLKQENLLMFHSQQQQYYNDENLYNSKQFQEKSNLSQEENTSNIEQINEMVEQIIFEEPLIIDVKGGNGQVFEVSIKQLSDLDTCFEEECEKQGLKQEDILATKITILTSIVQESLVSQNSKLLHEATMLLNEITLQYSLKIYEDLVPPESQESFIKLLRNENVENEVDSVYYGLNSNQMFANLTTEGIYSNSPLKSYNPTINVVSGNNYYHQLTSPILLNRFTQKNYSIDAEQQINLPEFNINDFKGDAKGSLSNLANGLFNNFIDFSRNPSNFQQNIGNVSPLAPPPGILGLGKQISLQQIPSQKVNHTLPYSVADIDSPTQVNRPNQQLFNIVQLNSQMNSQFKQDMQLTSPPAKNFLFKNISKPTATYSTRSGSQQQFGYIFQNASQKPYSINSNPKILAAPQASSNQINSTHTFSNIVSSEKFNAATMSSANKKSKPSNPKLQNGIYDQWKFNPSSLTNTPLLQPQQPSLQNNTLDSAAGNNGSSGRGQRIWQTQAPYLLETPTTNLLNKPSPQLNTTNNLFSKDLLSQLAQLGQPVK